MKDLKKMVLAALFTALICVATLSIRVPTPGTGGYIHPGDALVILSGIFLGPVYGFFAAGIGSACSDMLGGYFIYIPATLIIKGLVAYFTALAYKKIAAKNTLSRRYMGVMAGGIIDIVFVSGGYLSFELFLYQKGAFASLIPNLIQGCGGFVISLFLYSALSTVPEFRKLSYV